MLAKETRAEPELKLSITSTYYLGNEKKQKKNPDGLYFAPTYLENTFDVTV